MPESFWTVLSGGIISVDFFCRFLTGFWALKVTLRFVEPKQGGWWLALLYLMHLSIANTIVYTGVGDYLPPLFMLLFFITGLLVCCKGRLLARFSMGIILAILPISLNGILTSIRPPFDQYICLYMALFWGVTFFAISKSMPQNKRPPIYAWRLWLLIDLLALMPFGAAFSAITLTQPIPLNIDSNPFKDSLLVQNERVLLIILGLSVIASLVILSGVVLLSRHEKLAEEQMLWQIRSQYYQSLEESQQQVRRLRHDMSNHFTALRALDGDGMNRYLEQLIGSAAMQTGHRYCENLVANAVLSAKLPMIEDGKIENEWDVRLPKEMPITDIDLCALLANSLDNAIEANLKLPEAFRKISLSATVDKGFFMLKLINASGEPLPLQGGKVVTSKKNRELHGFGLAGIHEITLRYGGTAHLEHDRHTFCLLIMIPVVM